MAHTPNRDRDATNGTDPPPTDGDTSATDSSPATGGDTSASAGDTPTTESGADVPVDERSIRILAGLSEGSIDDEHDLALRGSTPAEVEAELREVHLPKLDAAGFIDWDPEAGTIEKGPRFEELALELEWSDWEEPQDG